MSEMQLDEAPPTSPASFGRSSRGRLIASCRRRERRACRLCSRRNARAAPAVAGGKSHESASLQKGVRMAARHADRRGGASRNRRRRRRLLLGSSLLVAGLLVLGLVGWEYAGTNWLARRAQAELRSDLLDRWGTPNASAVRRDAWPEGEAVALVRIPRFGSRYEMPMLAGVGEDELARGIGWFTSTARPGERGNFAIAAHRVTHGEPFRDFPDLQIGDEVVIETRTHIYTYRLEEDGDERTVDFEQTWILDSVPGHPEDKPERSMITLVTCASLFHTDNRNVVTGYLHTSQLKSSVSIS